MRATLTLPVVFFVLAVFLPTSASENNILKNGDFSGWRNKNIPASWFYYQDRCKEKFFSKVDRGFQGSAGLQISNHNLESHVIYQVVPVKKNTVYTAQALMWAENEDFQSGGLAIWAPAELDYGRWSRFKEWVCGSGDPPAFLRKIFLRLPIDRPRPVAGNLLAHHLFSGSTSGQEKNLRIAFNSGPYDQVVFCLGFFEGIGATVVFDNALLVEGAGRAEDDRSGPALTELLQRDSGIVKLERGRYNEQVADLMGYVNTRLLDSSPGRLAFYENNQRVLPPFFGGYLSSPIGKETSAYCQRSALSLAEVLAAYGVNTRQWHAAGKDGVGFHQFLEYFHPFEKHWIVIDPYYGYQFVEHGRLMGVTETLQHVKAGTFNEKLIRRLKQKYRSYGYDAVNKVWHADLQEGIHLPYDKVYSNLLNSPDSTPR